MGSMLLEGKGVTWNPNAFLKMYNLRFLEVKYIFHVPPTLHLPGDLRILDWDYYPSKSLPSSFQPDKLVQLCLQESQIEQLWIGIKVSVLLNILKQLWIERNVIVLLSILTTLYLNLNKENNMYLPFEKSCNKLLDLKCITLKSPLIS